MRTDGQTDRQGESHIPRLLRCGGVGVGGGGGGGGVGWGGGGVGGWWGGGVGCGVGGGGGGVGVHKNLTSMTLNLHETGCKFSQT